MKLGPFKVKKKLLPVTFELDLPKDTRLHPVFHATLLEMALQQIPTQTSLQMENDQEYEVEEVLDNRTTRRG